MCNHISTGLYRGPARVIVGVALAVPQRTSIRGLSKKQFVQDVYTNFILKILAYINVVPFKILPIRHNTLVPPPFPLLEAPLELLFS